MKRRMLPFLGLFVVLGLLVFPTLPQVLPAALPPAKYLLISRSSLFLGEDQTSSRALLITDPDEIRGVQTLATTIVGTGHRCGYDWSVTFWAGPSGIIDRHAINEACDQYDPRLKTYFQQIKDLPTHSIYDLRIPPHVEPQRVIRDLEEQDLTPFLMDGPNPHLPSVFIEVSPPENGEQVVSGRTQTGAVRLRSIVAEIAQDYAVKMLGSIHFPDHHHHGKSGYLAQATVWFEQGTVLTGISDRVGSLGGQVGSKYMPTSSYHIQFVDENQDLEAIQEQISSELEYVLEVSEYSSRRPSPPLAVDLSTRQFHRMTDRSLRLDAEGRPHLVYGRDQLHYIWHDGINWHAEIADPEPGAGASASLALDGSGYPHIAYQDQNRAGLKYAYRDDSGWNAETVHSKGTAGFCASLALGSDGYAHISYYDETNRDLRHAYKTTSGWYRETVENPRGTAASTSLVLDRAGYAHISYHDAKNKSVEYAFQDASGWHIEAVDQVGSLGGGYTSLALDVGGSPHISYSDGYPEFEVKYAHRDGSGWHVETVDYNGFDGAYTSLALDRDGFAHISYYNRVSGPLNYAYRDRYGWHVETVDSELIEIRATSLALDGNGHPHIGYDAWSSGELKYAHRDGTGWHVETVR